MSKRPTYKRQLDRLSWSRYYLSDALDDLESSVDTAPVGSLSVDDFRDFSDMLDDLTFQVRYVVKAIERERREKEKSDKAFLRRLKQRITGLIE